MKTENNIYLSDLLAVPMPQHAASRRSYLRKIRVRRLLWALLPYLFEALGMVIAVTLTVIGIFVCVVGFGG